MAVKQKGMYDFSEEGESDLDPTPTLLIQVIGGKSAGKTTTSLNFDPAGSAVIVSFDGESKPIADKLADAGRPGRIYRQKGDRYMWKKVKVKEGDDVLRFVPKEDMPRAAAMNLDYLKALLQPENFGGPVDVVIFDDAATMEKLCEQAARAEHNLGYAQTTQNPQFWGSRNQNLRDLLILAESLAKKAVIFCTGYEFGHGINDPQPDDIKGEWTRRADIVIHSVAKRQSSRGSDEINMRYIAEILSCKRDDLIVPTGRVFDMNGTDFADHWAAYFA